jgi:hypothetical protein
MLAAEGSVALITSFTTYFFDAIVKMLFVFLLTIFLIAEGCKFQKDE